MPGEPVVTAGQKAGEPIQQPTEPKGQTLTLTQEEFDQKLQSEADRRVQKAIETNRQKWDIEHKDALKHEREEAERLALMSAAERQKELEKQRIKEISERENTLNRREIQLKAIKALDEESLPVSFAEILLGQDENSTMTNIANFKKSWITAIDTEVKRRLKGKTPEGGQQHESADMNAIIRRMAGRK